MEDISPNFYRKSILGFFIAAIILVLVMVSFLAGYNNGSKMAHLEINVDGHKRVFEGEVVSGMTILSALQASALAGNIALNLTTDENNRIVIDSLDGYSASKTDKKINFYLNSSRVDLGSIGSTKIKSGDFILITAQ